MMPAGFSSQLGLPLARWSADSTALTVDSDERIRICLTPIRLDFLVTLPIVDATCSCESQRAPSASNLGDPSLTKVSGLK